MVALFSDEVHIALCQAFSSLKIDRMETICCSHEGWAFMTAAEHGLQAHTSFVHKLVQENFVGESFVHNGV